MTDWEDLHLLKIILPELIFLKIQMVGDMDIKMQLDALDWYLEQSDQVLSELLPVAAKKEKVIKCIGVLTGIFLVVLLM